jgi:macrodomain Ter protein organizer (MatP/YcbG family)
MLVKQLKNEEEAIRQKRLRIENGEIFPMKKKYVNMENNLRGFLAHNSQKYGKCFVFRLQRYLFY